MASSSGVKNRGSEDVYSFQIEEEDLEELTVGNEGEEEGIDDRWCLVGRFLTNRLIDFDKMQNILASLWQPGMGMFVKKLEDNRFLFQFYHEVDIQRVINGSPWTYDRMQLIIQRLPVGGDPNLLQLNDLDMWVQIHDIKPGCMTTSTVRGVGNTLEKFIESDPNNFIGVWRDYFRVRVILDIRKPLRRRMKLTRDNGSWFWAHFKYERVPTFCFICGLIGHSERFCRHLFQQPIEQIVKPYGEFMRAVPQKSYKNIEQGGCIIEVAAKGVSQGQCTQTSYTSTKYGKKSLVDLADNHANQNMTNKEGNNGMDNLMMEGDQCEEDTGIMEGEVSGDIYGKNKAKGKLIEGNSGVVIFDNKKRKVREDGIMGHVGQAQQTSGLEKVGALSLKMGFEGCFVVEAQGRSGGLALMWKSEEEVVIDSFSMNHIDCFVHFEGYRKFWFTGFYGEPNRRLRENTWELLRTLHARYQEAWCIMGDFNNILHNKEKRGGKPYPSWLLDGFQEVVRHCGLCDLDMHGHSFTWEKGRDTSAWMEARLDRAMVNFTWLTIFSDAKLFNLEVSPSDHTPLFLDIMPLIQAAGKKQFRFENHWTRFQECEEVIRQRWMSLLVLKIFSRMRDAEGLNDTNIVLIPKKKKPDQMSELRPISLCNVVAKVITKVLANRLKGLLSRIISLNQSAFIPGRLITDNIMVSFEVLHYLKRGIGKEGCMALKLDLSKAYDRVDWHFLTAMLSRLGFCDKWVRLIYGSLCSVQYHIVSSGYTMGPILPSRGLRQGDPISPYLFLICLGRVVALIQHYEERKFLHGCRVANGAPIVSHLLFADDSFLYCKATDREVSNVQRMLEVFANASGQRVNFEKSSVFFSTNTTIQMRRTIYLGKEVLIKAVVQALPAYTMNLFLLPMGFCPQLESVVSRFWWKSSNSKGIHWLSWVKLTDHKVHREWLLDVVNPYIETSSRSLQGQMVQALMQVDKLEWDNEVISDVLNDRDRELVWRIPLSSARRNDNWFWLQDSSGIFSVRSAYRLQHEANNNVNHAVPTDVWSKLWSIKVPPKEGLAKWSEVESIEAAMTLWAVWKMRNDVVWNSISPSSEEVIHTAQVNFLDWCNAQQLENDTLPGSNMVLFEKWCPPTFPSFKVNVDGALFNSNGRYGVGMVARCAAGVMLQARTVLKSGMLQPHEVEAIGIKEALGWIKSNGCNGVVLESDCLRVISDIKSKKNMVSPYGHIIFECKALCVEVSNLSLS
uniref:Reverse transcriptase domain-containing protein n=1 Tax=Cannabis sativa TaxID=3483 RepID=A0A803NUT6_CANSA